MACCDTVRASSLTLFTLWKEHDMQKQTQWVSAAVQAACCGQLGNCAHQLTDLVHPVQDNTCQEGGAGGGVGGASVTECDVAC